MLHPRARTMLLLSIPAVIIGIASSPVLIVTMKIAAILQHVIWSSVPLSLGIESQWPAVDYRRTHANRYCRGTGGTF